MLSYLILSVYRGGMLARVSVSHAHQRSSRRPSTSNHASTTVLMLHLILSYTRVFNVLWAVTNCWCILFCLRGQHTTSSAGCQTGDSWLWTCTWTWTWTSRRRQVTAWHLELLANRVFVQHYVWTDKKKHKRSALLSLCEGNPPVTGGFPSQRDRNAENISIVWRHNVNMSIQIISGAIPPHHMNLCWNAIDILSNLLKPGAFFFY